MADLTTRPTRLLGFAPRDTGEHLAGALNALSGPRVQAIHGPTLSAFLQDEPSTPLPQRGRRALLEALQSVHQRLELACLQGPFLPADPASATCPAKQVHALLQQLWPNLEMALAEFGARRQWDLVARWSPQAVLAHHRATLSEVAATHNSASLASTVAAILKQVRDRRAALLSDALTTAGLALAPSGGSMTETELSWTVLTPPCGDHTIEAALLGVPSQEVTDMDVDLRGPMPPVSFHAVRLLRIAPSEAANSWRLLDLPERVDPSALHRQWRALAATCHPDRSVNETAAAERFVALGAAYRLLRPLVGPGGTTLRALLRQNGYRIEVPETTSTACPEVEAAA